MEYKGMENGLRILRRRHIPAERVVALSPLGAQRASEVNGLQVSFRDRMAALPPASHADDSSSQQHLQRREQPHVVTMGGMQRDTEGHGSWRQPAPPLSLPDVPC